MKKRVVGLVLLVVALVARPVLAVEPLPLEPTVTAREAERLEQAAAVAVTNVPQAIALLEAGGLENASAALDFAVGNFHFQLDQYEPAIAAYEAAVQKLPSFRNARKNMGRAWLLLEREDKAMAVYQRLVADGHFDADTFLLLGHSLMLRGHGVPAESAYRQALLLEPENRDARRGLIQALLDQERYAEARNLLRAALDTAPTDAGHWQLLANLEVALENTTGAIRAVETARRLAAASPSALMLLGDLYLDAGQPADAVRVYEAALATDSLDTARFLRAVEGLVLLGEESRAAALLKDVTAAMDEAVLEMPETERTLKRLRAEIAMLAGKGAQAIAMYRELVDRDPLDARALLRLGDLLVEHDALGEAELVFERAGRLPGHEAESLARQARIAVQENRVDDAIALLERAERIEPRPHITRYLEQLRRLAE